MKTLQASQKVEFARHLTGQEVINVISQIIGNAKNDPHQPMLYRSQRDKLGFAFTIGQTSIVQYQQLIVVPTRKSSWIYPDYFNLRDDYLEVEVLSQFWSARKPFDAAFSEADKQQAVSDFADKLRQHHMVR